MSKSELERLGYVWIRKIALATFWSPIKKVRPDYENVICRLIAYHERSKLLKPVTGIKSLLFIDYR